MSSCHTDSKEVYAIPGFEDGRRCYKVGFALDPLMRKATHQTSRADTLRIELRCFYIDGTRAEKYIKQRLTEMGHLIRGENFDAPFEVIKRLFEEASARDQKLWDSVQYMYHRRRLNDIVPAKDVIHDGSNNSAIQFLFNQLVRVNGAVSSLQSVLFDAFDDGARSRSAKALQKYGLMLLPEAEIALLDKRPGSKLYDIFEKGSGCVLWKTHLQGIAAVGKQLNTISMRELVNGPWATPALLGVCLD